MGEFTYNEKMYSYHSMGLDMEDAIIPLGKPRGLKTALYEFTTYFANPDSKGFRFKVMWLEYEEGETAYDRAAETKIMTRLSGCHKSHFVVFDEEGAETLIEIHKNWPELIDRIFADEDKGAEISKVLAELPDDLKVEYLYAPDAENLFIAVKSAIFGKKMDCPFCGHPMQMGYIYAPQDREAQWTMDPDRIGNYNTTGDGKVLPMREDFTNYDSLGELLSRHPADSVSRGFLCRHCGKMIVDMSHALIYFKDKVYFEANGLPENYTEVAEEDENIVDSFTVWGESLRNMFGAKNKGKSLGRQPKDDPGAPAKPEKEYRGKRDDEEPKRRSIFGRGPKVE
ncbi:MAG: PF20097 family protein [Clostridiales bacterium]|nr:PF20097 family protein [Clostridiales bacterium]